MPILNPLKNGIKKIGLFIKNHKFISAILLIAMAGGLFYGYNIKPVDTKTYYTLATVGKDTITTSVSGTGQVSASDTIEIKPKASGEITKLNIKAGDLIKAGTVIATIDSTDAQKTVRDAQINLQNAQLAMDKLKKPTDSYSISSAENDLTEAKLALQKLQDPPTDYEISNAQNDISQAQRDLDQAKDNKEKTALDTEQNLQKAYDDGYTAVSNIYLDLPDLVNDIKKVVDSDDNDTSIQNRIQYYKLLLGENSPFVKNLYTDYETISQNFYKEFANYKSTLRSADTTTQYALLKSTYDISSDVSHLLESCRNVLDAVTKTNYQDYAIAQIVDSLKTTINNDISKINKDITSLQSAKDTIDNENKNSPLEIKTADANIKAAEEKLAQKQAALLELKKGPTEEDLISAQNKITQKEQALQKLKDEPDALDVKAQQLTIQQRVNSLNDAKSALGDYTVKAPFDCTVSKVSVLKGDNVSSGTSIATVISKNLVAEISLNEVDAAKVAIGNKATLTFDALDSITVTGKVASIDTVGTVTQGVVTYGVKIAFDTTEEKVKPGMSVSASIITAVKQDVLVVANSAIKTQNNVKYVEMFEQNNSETSTKSQKENSTQLENSTQEKSNKTESINTQSTNTSANETITSDNPPIQQQVEVGIANDTYTEITSGLSEGDKIVIKTTTGSASKASSSTSKTSSSQSSRSGSVGGMMGMGRF